MTTMIRELTRSWRRWAAHNRVRVTIVMGLLYVTFSVPEKQMITAKQRMLETGEDLVKKMIPTLRLPNGTMYDVKGRLDFLDNVVDSTTGTVAARSSVAWCVFVNLFAGMGRAFFVWQYCCSCFARYLNIIYLFVRVSVGVGMVCVCALCV